MAEGRTGAPTEDVARYALRLGDDALVLAQRLGEWPSWAPDLEEDIALTNIALDLLGQARQLLTYAGSYDGRTEDDLAYLRPEREFTNVCLVELPSGDFAVTVVRQLFFSAYQGLLYRELARSADATLAGVAARAVKEVAYHLDHAVQWTLRLGDGTDESRRRIEAALTALWPYAGELFEPDPLTDRLAATGIGVDSARLGPEWTDQLGAVLGEATLAMPKLSDPDAPRSRLAAGRRGLHTEAFGHLLAEMQLLRRSYPDAE